MNSADDLAVKRDRVVGLRYIMRNRHHEVLEDRMSGDPVFYLQGGSSVLPALQKQLEEMKPGDVKQIWLRSQEECGTPDFSFDVVIFSVRAATNAELELGYPLPLAADCAPDCECYSELTGNGKRSGSKPDA